MSQREPLAPASAPPSAEQLTAAAAAHWDRQIDEPSVYWTQPPRVAEYVNDLITGVRFLGPTHALKIGWAYEPLPRGLSIGCGAGDLERDLYRLRICERIDAFDISRESLKRAKTLARRNHMKGIHYRRGDFNNPKLRSARYDIVFFHGSLHHAADPDRLLDEVRKTLKAGGFLYVDEYVGPSRDEWGDDLLQHVRQEYELLDERLKRHPVAPPIAPGDPSEMLRSSRILPAIRERFEIVHYRPYWGNLLFPLFCAIRGEEVMKPANDALIARWVDRERALVNSGAFQEPLFAVVLARKT